jgi:hypothetical protein
VPVPAVLGTLLVAPGVKTWSYHGGVGIGVGGGRVEVWVWAWGVVVGGIITCGHAGAVVAARSRYQQCCQPLCLEKQTKGAAREQPGDGWV